MPRCACSRTAADRRDVIEARVALLRARGRRRIVFLEIREHRVHRRVQRVQVEAVEPAALLRRTLGVVLAQPRRRTRATSSLRHIHRGNRSNPASEASRAVVVVDLAAHVAIGAQASGQSPSTATAVNPARDQPPRDRRTQIVEVVRAVGRLAEQHEPLVRDQLDDLVQLVLAVESVARSRHRFGNFTDGNDSHDRKLAPWLAASIVRMTSHAARLRPVLQRHRCAVG